MTQAHGSCTHDDDQVGATWVHAHNGHWDTIQFTAVRTDVFGRHFHIFDNLTHSDVAAQHVECF